MGVVVSMWGWLDKEPTVSPTLWSAGGLVKRHADGDLNEIRIANVKCAAIEIDNRRNRPVVPNSPVKAKPKNAAGPVLRKTEHLDGGFSTCA